MTPAPEWHAICPPLRACQLCVHGTGQGEHRMCSSPAVTQGRFAPQPVALVRQNGGACGPDAAHLHLGTWGPAP